ncbi:MAG: peptidylprolyl isomerase [Oligoflexia bacterium]|nr:peptidylprolyl isomerase [Oligoflexia bacterium]
MELRLPSFQEVQDYMELRLPSFQENKSNIKEEILKEIVFYSLLKNWAEKNSIFLSKTLLAKEERLLFAKNKKKLKALKVFKLYTNLKQALLKELEKKTPDPSISQQKSFYTKNKAQFIEPAQCQLQQILVGNKKLAQSLHSRIKDGESFSALNKIYSLKENPGWVKKGLWALFDKACFEEEKSLSSVLKSPYGWHIFLRTGKKADRQKSFSESQKEVLKILKKQSLPLQLKNWLKEESLKTPFFKDKKLLDQIKIQYKRNVL